MTREIRDLLGPLDPAPAEPLVPARDRQADLHRILGIAVPRRAARGRRALLVAAALVLVALVAVPFVRLPEPTYAATPEPLAYAGAGGDAATILAGLADRAATAPATPRAGEVEHLVTLSWDLWTRVDGERARSAIVPTRTETWRRADDSGRLRASYLEPQFPAGTDRWWWRLHGSPGGGDQPRGDDYPPGGFPAMWAGRPPTTGFADWLRIGHPVENGPAEVLVAVTDLVRERVLTPADRAAVLRTVADLPGLSSDGTVVDRAGRSGLAFSLVSDYSGLPTRYTLIVDPVTGAPLGFESMLTTRAGKLDVRVPAVVGYETYATAEFIGDPG